MANGSKLVQVAYVQRHTVALDKHGQVSTLGDNKYSQLGRLQQHSKDAMNTIANTEPQLLEVPLGKMNTGCFAIHCGWSHILALVCSENDDSGGAMLYGWGRNDKEQLGMMSTQSNVPVPQILKPMSNAIGSGESVWEYSKTMHVLKAVHLSTIRDYIEKH